jgi:hypothetical protein
MKILFVAVFTDNNRSTNDSQAVALERIGHEVVRYNYRVMEKMLGSQGRDAHIINTTICEEVDLVIFSKGKGIDIRVIEECNKVSDTCLWFMDAYMPNHWTEELIQKIQLCTFVCCDKVQAVAAAIRYNPRTYHVCEGYDNEIDKPHNLPQDIPISFIGDPYGYRRNVCDLVGALIFEGAYGEDHAKVVSRSKINLNFCTYACASDRIYKILGAGGLLFTDDWEGRELEDGKDLVLFSSIPELRDKIDYYTRHTEEAQRIRERGYLSVQKYSRIEWARNICNCFLS